MKKKKKKKKNQNTWEVKIEWKKKKPKEESRMLLHKYFWSKCQLIFSPDFSLIWGDCILVGLERKHPNSTKFPSPFLSQPNNAKVIFSHIFFSFFFHPLSKSLQPNGLLVVEFVLGCNVKKISEGVC